MKKVKLSSRTNLNSLIGSDKAVFLSDNATLETINKYLKGLTSPTTTIGSDLNSFTNPGEYLFSNSPNRPSDTSAGILIVKEYAGYLTRITQEVISDEGMAFLRVKRGSNEFSEWRSL